MDNREYWDIGRKLSHSIGRAVRTGMRTGNFGQMGRDMADGAHEVADSVKQAADHACGGRPFYPPADLFGGMRPRARRSTARMSRTRMPGRVSGTIDSIIGFFVGIPLLLTGVFGAISRQIDTNFWGTITVIAILTAAAFLLVGIGIRRRRQARRFSRYHRALGGAAFSSVSDLAAAAGQPPERARKDLQKMIETGVYPQGHFDDTGTWFIVDDATYEEYLEAQKAYEKRQSAEHAEQEKRQKDPKGAELEAVEKEGQKYLSEIRAANDALSGKTISGKLNRLEDVTTRIFQCVKQHPEKLPEIRRFLRYYMPATLKLVKSYQEFESQPVRGENIANAEQEIESAFDTINTAFANLLDTLYADDALDVSADISTLETMLKQEGLTGSDFVKQPGEPVQTDASGKNEQEKKEAEVHQ